ncbi:MAG: hypothetical protein ACR2MG_01910 [Pyrinomonadaceae bacterium]
MKNHKKFTVVFRLALCLGLTLWIVCQNNSTSAQTNDTKTKNFRQVVKKRLSKFKRVSIINGKSIKTNVKLEEVCPIDTDLVAKRIFVEYGAVFIADDDVRIPTKCIFADENEVQVFQNDSHSQTAVVGEISITLQEPAMNALLEAQQEAAKQNLQITPRGDALAAKRSYQDTVELWNSRFYPALNYWVEKGRISREQAETAKQMAIHEQIARVLEWETKGLFFSKDLSKSILYSVAAPGASQHIFMLALDVEQFANLSVRNILAKHGWFQTVKSDFPHFTYLGVKESNLPQLGLKPFLINRHKFWLTNHDF